MNSMFFCCNSLISLDLSNFNTQNLACTISMLENCYSLISLDISNFNTEKIINLYKYFIIVFINIFRFTKI